MGVGRVGEAVQFNAARLFVQDSSSLLFCVLNSFYKIQSCTVVYSVFRPGPLFSNNNYTAYHSREKPIVNGCFFCRMLRIALAARFKLCDIQRNVWLE